jgi:hypothetical protein
MAILSHHLPEPLRADLAPVLHRLEEQPVQPLVAGESLLKRHGDSCRFP